MPITPYHLGPGSLIGVSLKKYLYVPSVLVGSVILDIEPFMVLFLELKRPLHILTHNLLVATIAVPPLTAIMYFFRAEINKIMKLFRFEQEATISGIALGLFAGTWSHVILDAFLYTDMIPLFPFKYNPFVYKWGMRSILSFCVACFILAAANYAIYLFINRNDIRKKSEEGTGP